MKVVGNHSSRTIIPCTVVTYQKFEPPPEVALDSDPRFRSPSPYVVREPASRKNLLESEEATQRRKLSATQLTLEAAR